MEKTIIYFEFLDFTENSNLPRMVSLTINNTKKEIKEKIMIFNETFPISFNSYIYLNVPLICEFSNKKRVNFILTIYLSKINYFKGFCNGIFINSIELIKTSIYPIENLNFEIELCKNEKQYFIKGEEEYEKISNRKRINLFNLEFFFLKNINFQNKMFSNNILTILDDEMNILGVHKKQITPDPFKINDIDKQYILQLLLPLKQFFDDYSIDKKFEINEKQFINLSKIILNIKCNLFDDNIFNTYIQQDLEDIFFNELDYEIYKLYSLYYLILKIINYKNDDIIKIIEYLVNHLLSFEKECKYINDKIMRQKLFFVASLALSDFPQIYIENDKYKEYLTKENQLISLIDFDEENIYKNANNKNIEFINNLNESSFIFYYLLQFNSGFSRNIWYNHFENSGMISMITLKELKDDLLKCIPKYGIRLFFNNDNLAFTELYKGITVINEIKLFNHKLNKDELKSESDSNYYKRFIISFLLKHERMAHLKHMINKSIVGYKYSPRIYYDIINKKIHYFDIREIGNSLEYFFGNFSFEFYNNLFNLYQYKEIIFENLFNDITLWVDNSSERLINEFNKINDFIQLKVKKGEIEKEGEKINYNKNIKKRKNNPNYEIDEEEDELDPFKYSIKRHKFIKFEVKNIKK